jgi:hypothetical protein
MPSVGQVYEVGSYTQHRNHKPISDTPFCVGMNEFAHVTKIIVGVSNLI